ncbi:SGF29 tudor-like domain-containing protein [Kalaharituber pfeilii]|nr:SGF29 tudor-like domain-containing protein [Kalaharituber pfeilii]
MGAQASRLQPHLRPVPQSRVNHELVQSKRRGTKYVNTSPPRASHHHPAHHHPTAKPDDPPDTHEESLFWSKIVGSSRACTPSASSEEDPETSAQDLLRLASQYEDLLELVEVLEKNLATAYEDTQVLIGLRTATEGGDRAADTKRKKRKLDDTTDSPRPPTPAAKSPAPPLPRPALPTSEGEYIQCIIIDISEVNGKKRYTIQDPEPDESRGHAQVYKAPASALIPIPKDSTGLPAYPVGKQVLAMYPETTMFYRAEVMGTKRDGTCRLKFEGEEEVGKETEVERRLVLDVSGR